MLFVYPFGFVITSTPACRAHGQCRSLGVFPETCTYRPAIILANAFEHLSWQVATYMHRRSMSLPAWQGQAQRRLTNNCMVFMSVCCLGACKECLSQHANNKTCWAAAGLELASTGMLQRHATCMSSVSRTVTRELWHAPRYGVTAHHTLRGSKSGLASLAWLRLEQGGAELHSN